MDFETFCALQIDRISHDLFPPKDEPAENAAGTDVAEDPAYTREETVGEDAWHPSTQG